MAGVQQIKTTVGKNNFFSRLLDLAQLFFQQVDRDNMIFERICIHLKKRCTVLCGVRKSLTPYTLNLTPYTSAF